MFHLAFSLVFQRRWLPKPCPSMFQPSKLRSRTERPPQGRPWARRSVAITAWAPVTLVVAVYRLSTCMNSSAPFTAMWPQRRCSPIGLATWPQTSRPSRRWSKASTRNLEKWTRDSRIWRLPSTRSQSVLSLWNRWLPRASDSRGSAPYLDIPQRRKDATHQPASPRLLQEWTRTMRTHGVLPLCAARVLRGVQEWLS